MKFIFTLLITAYCFYAQAQTDLFNETVSKIEQHIKLNQWDEIVLLAPDLLLEAPEKGDGYYYIALAFFKMGQTEMTNEYLQLAEVLTHPELQVKIDALKVSMKTNDSELEAVANAQKLESEGKLKEAAAAWDKIWSVNKKNLDYALNAVGLYVNLKLFPEALTILNDEEVSKDSEAQELVKRLNDTKQMKSINGYNESMTRGLTLMKQEKYQAAIQKFDEALSFRPKDKAATDQRNIALDEIAWDKAFEGYTIESFEAYLAGNTLREHYQEAHNNIKRKLVNFGEQYARNMDIANMEKFFNKYLSNYPSGDDVAKVKQIMCDTYYNKGSIDALPKYKYAQDEALISYEKARKICKDKPDLEEKIKLAKRLSIRYGRPDRFFYTYSYDPICKIGFSFGTTNNQTVGAYLTVRCNSAFFSSTGSNGTVDNAGVVTGGQYTSWGNDWRYRDETRTGTVEGLIGITKKIAYPLWIYTGIGVSYNEVAWKMDIYDNLGDYYTTDWVKNSDESKFGFAMETGLIVDLSGFHLRTGLKMNNFENLTVTLGVGFSLERQ